ncbi:phage tail tape measure protein [Neobacillus piezotolerans]|uniref:Phage tail tape measure protein n=1 Tax=Neobacillus piezotolerans TaxID=2259171 RepID=A0A3D8GMB8_9BACI|nr:phage tail tape measure protein [Neobacillus piezotolerans]RDU35482.1 phage tail tape measure protein [Neobacillus piezotolerans]
MEEIGALKVSLSLESADFTRSMASIDRNLKTLGGELATIRNKGKEWGESIQGLTTKQDALGRTLNAQKIKVDQLSDAYERSKREKGADAKETEQLAVKLNKAVAEYTRTETELNQVNTALQKQQNELKQSKTHWERMSDSMKEAGQRLQDVGGRMQAAGQEIAMNFGAAAAAIGAGLGVATKKAMDFESQMSSVKSVMSPDEARKYGAELEKLAIVMGADTKYSALEAAQGIEELVKAGVSITDVLKGGLEGALNLATAGELQLADAAEIASTALNAFKADSISVSKAADILAGAANASATSVSEMKFSLSAVSAVASGVGLSFKDTSTALAVMAQNGLKGSDAGTSLKTMLLRLSPTTKSAYEAFDQLGLATYNNAAGYKYLIDKGIKPASRHVEDITKGLEELTKQELGSQASKAQLKKRYEENLKASGLMSSAFYNEKGELKSMADIAGILQDAMKDLNNEQRQVYLNAMFGTDAIRAGNILFKEGAKGINDMADAMDKIKAADVAAEKLNNLKGKMEELSGAFETGLISLGDALLPVISKAVEGLQWLADGFNELSPGMKQFIAIGGLITTAVLGMVAAFGGFFAILGSGISGLGALVGLLGSGAGLAGAAGAAAGGTGLLAGAITLLTGPVGIAAAAIAGLTIAGVALYKHLSKDSIPEVDRFGNKVSESTKKALDSYFTLSDEATKSLMELSFSQQVVTKEMKDKLVGIYKEMNGQILAKMDERHTQQLEQLRKFFQESNALTVTEEQKIINEQLKKHEESIKKQKEKEAQILAILEKAVKEKRQITESEGLQIADINRRMNEDAIKYLSKNELESKAILERMKSTAGDLTARQAAEVVQSSYKQKEEAVKAANEMADEKIKAWIRLRDETGEINAEQFERLKAESIKQRDEVVSKAKDMHQKVVAAAKAQATEHVNEVDWETGQVRSKFGKMLEDIKTQPWHETGKDIMGGLISGIQVMMNPLSAILKGVAKMIPDTLKDKLDINSPSKVLADQVGKWIPLGVAEGITKNLAAVNMAAIRMTSAAVPSMGPNGPLGNSYSTASNTYHIGNITITSDDMMKAGQVVRFFELLPQAIKAR